MEASEFETFRASLGTLGFRAVDSMYDEAAFGSWLIVLDDPPVRVVWDGKDSRLVVQQRTATVAEQLALLK